MFGYVFDAITGRKKGAAARGLLGALRALEEGYKGALAARGGLYRAGLITQRRAPLKVISVGNITVGGTGKTPLVATIARRLAKRKKKVAIITRGYGPKVRGGEADEVILLRNHCPDAHVIVDGDKWRGCVRAKKEHGAEVALLDDGFQHLRLARDLDIVAVDATNPFGFGHLLPRGLLRERPEGLARADVVVVTRADLVDEDELESLMKRLARLAGERKPVCAMRHAPRALIDSNGKKRGPGFLEGRPVGAFCAIANPYAFGLTMRGLGYKVVFSKKFPDHRRFTRGELEMVFARARAKGATAVVTTEKDGVKLPGDLDPALPLYLLSVELEFVEGERRFWRAVYGAAKGEQNVRGKGV